MKKIFNIKLIFVSLITLVLFPSIINAKELDVSGTDLSNGGSVNSVTGSGRAIYDLTTNVLTLDNYKGQYINISEMPANFTIKLVGTSTLNWYKEYRFYPEKHNRNYYYDNFITLHHDVDINIIGDSKDSSKLIFKYGSIPDNVKTKLYSIDAHDLEYNSLDEFSFGNNKLSISNATIESENSANGFYGINELNVENSSLFFHKLSDRTILGYNANIINSNIKVDYADSGLSFYGKLYSKNSNYDLTTCNNSLYFSNGSIIDGGEFNIKSYEFDAITINSTKTDDIIIKDATFNLTYDSSLVTDYNLFDVSVGIGIDYDETISSNINIVFENDVINIWGYRTGIAVIGENVYMNEDNDLSKEEIESIAYYPLNLTFRKSDVNVKKIRNIGISLMNTNFLVDDSKFNVSSEYVTIVEGLSNSSLQFEYGVDEYEIFNSKRNKYFKQSNITFTNSDVLLESYISHDILDDVKIYKALINVGFDEKEAKYSVLANHFYLYQDYDLDTYISEINKLGFDQDELDDMIFWAKFKKNMISKDEFLDYYVNVYGYTKEEALEELKYYNNLLSSLGTIILTEGNINFESGNIIIKSNGKNGIIGIDNDINFNGANVNIADSEYGIYMLNNGNRPATINFNNGIFKTISKISSIYINDISNNAKINFDKHMGLRNFNQGINVEEKNDKKIITVVNNEKDKKTEKEIEVTKKYYFVDLKDINKEIKNYIYDISKTDDFVVRIDGDLSKFSNIEIDGKIVDTSNYELSEGSTIVKFSKKFLKSIGLGKHTMIVNYTDYGIARTNFDLINNDINKTKDVKGAKNITNPNTGDLIIHWLIVFIISTGGLIYCLKNVNKWLKY